MPDMHGVHAVTGEVIAIGPAHPVADLFPMLTGEDLQELADSIADQGQLHPIVLDDEGRILDGRNRAAACELIGVKPLVTLYDGDDPDGYALAVNVARRHLSKGQRAMLAARAVLLSNASQEDIAQAIDVSRPRVSQAKVVLDYAPDLADGVVAGTHALNDAYKAAQDRKKAATDETAQMAKLNAEAPDLADLVAEERMALKEAIAALRERKEEDKRQRTVATHLLCQNIVTVAQLHGGTTGERYDPDLALPGRVVTRRILLDARAAIDTLLTVWEARDLP